MNKNKSINYDKIIELHKKGLNDTEISITLNCSVASVNKYRRKLNLPKNFKYTRKFDINDFTELYSLGLSDTKIAEKLKVSTSAIQDYRKSLNLVSNAYKYENVILTPDQEQVLIGGLLGDGYCRLRENCVNAKVQFAHSIKQETYLKYKRSFFEELSTEIRYESQVHKKTNREYFTCKFWLKTNPVYNYYHKAFYYDGVKRVTSEILNKLKPLGIAIWFMDDGNFNNGNYEICTNAFDSESLLNIKAYFSKEHQLSAKITKRNTICFNVEDSKKLKKLIESYFIDEMKYKLNKKEKSCLNSVNSVNTQ